MLLNDVVGPVVDEAREQAIVQIVDESYGVDVGLGVSRWGGGGYVFEYHEIVPATALENDFVRAGPCLKQPLHRQAGSACAIPRFFNERRPARYATAENAIAQPSVKNTSV